MFLFRAQSLWLVRKIVLVWRGLSWREDIQPWWISGFPPIYIKERLSWLEKKMWGRWCFYMYVSRFLRRRTWKIAIWLSYLKDVKVAISSSSQTSWEVAIWLSHLKVVHLMQQSRHLEKWPSGCLTLKWPSHAAVQTSWEMAIWLSHLKVAISSSSPDLLRNGHLAVSP